MEALGLKGRPGHYKLNLDRRCSERREPRIGTPTNSKLEGPSITGHHRKNYKALEEANVGKYIMSKQKIDRISCETYLQ